MMAFQRARCYGLRLVDFQPHLLFNKGERKGKQAFIGNLSLLLEGCPTPHTPE